MLEFGKTTGSVSGVSGNADTPSSVDPRWLPRPERVDAAEVEVDGELSGTSGISSSSETVDRRLLPGEPLGESATDAGEEEEGPLAEC